MSDFYLKGQSLPKQLAFTLVELIIALFIFSILSALSFKAITFYSNTSENLTAESNNLTELSKLFTFLEKDVRTAQDVFIPDQPAQSSGAVVIELKNLYKHSFTRPICIKYSFDGNSSVSRNLFSCELLVEFEESKGISFSMNISSFAFNPIVTEKGAIEGLKVTLVDSDFGKITRSFYRPSPETPGLVLPESFDADKPPATSSDTSVP